MTSNIQVYQKGNIHIKIAGKLEVQGLRQCKCYYLFLIYGISYDCDNVCVLFFCLMIDELYSNYSYPYRSQTALRIHSVGILGTRRDFVWFHPKFFKIKKFPTRKFSCFGKVFSHVCMFSYFVQSFASFVMFSFSRRHTTNIHSHFIVHLDGRKLCRHKL